MNHEDLILSEYLDGELPADIAQGVERRLEQDPALRKRLDAMRTLRLPEPLGSFDVAVSSVRVWNSLEWSTRGKPVRSPLRRMAEFFTKKVSLPVPAFAAMALVVGVLGVFSLLRGGQDAASGLSELARSDTQPVMYSSLGARTVQSGLPVAENVLTVPAAEAAASATQSLDQSEDQSAGLAVTFEVESLQELLQILEGREQIQELKIRLPALQELTPMGEPVLMKATEAQIQEQGGQP